MVLTYHRILDEPDFQDPLKVSVANFEKQILFLKKDYQILSGKEVGDIIRKGQPFPQNSCLITFDDGWRDNYTHAFPILKKYEVPALIFISTDYIGTSKVFWHEQLVKIFSKMPSHFQIEKHKSTLNKWPHELCKRMIDISESGLDERQTKIHELTVYLKGFNLETIDQIKQDIERFWENGESENYPLMLSWEEVQEMLRNNICFGSHTKRHVILTRTDEDKIKEELFESKERIESKINQPVYFLSYPNGDYNDFVIKIAREAGFLASFTCNPGTNISSEHPFELKRNHINEDSSLDWNGYFSELFFKVELSGIRLYLKSWQKVEKY